LVPSGVAARWVLPGPVAKWGLVALPSLADSPAPDEFIAHEGNIECRTIFGKKNFKNVFYVFFPAARSDESIDYQ
jgi:hypothetical protein